MADLPWFPVYRGGWLNSSAIAAMLPEQEGAYWRLLVTSWGDGNAEPSLPADDGQLAMLSRLGSRWKKLGAPVRAMFVERDGRLYNEKLSEVWQEQRAKHTAASEKAKKAGLARAAKQRPEPASSSAPSTASRTPEADFLSREKLEGTASPSTPNGVEREKHVPAPMGALAPAGAAPRAPGAVPIAGRIAAEQAEREDRDRRYFALLTARAEAWMREHRDDALAFGAEERALLGFPKTGELSDALKRIVRDAVIERIRAAEGWPASDEWDGSATLTHALEPAPC